jgi:hypothetical protein
VNHAGEASASPQQAQRNLRVLKLSQGLQKRLSFGSALGGVGLRECIIANGRSEKLKVSQEPVTPIRVLQQGDGETRLQGRQVHGAHGHGFALVQVQREAQLGSASLHMSYSLAHSRNVPCQDTVVQEVQGDVQGRRPELGGQGLQSCSEQ